MATSDVPDISSLTIREIATADEADIAWVQNRMRRFNTEKPGGNDFRVLHLFLRDAKGRLQGGLLGWTLWSWMHIDALWVEEALRGHGLGLRLLQEAERIAAQRGCRQAETDTFSFQAPGFYEKAGYTVFGKLEGIGGRFTRYYVRKDLS